MKSKTITFEEVEYEIRSFGFFKANRILVGTLVPLFKSISGTLQGLEEGQVDMKEMFTAVASELSEDKVEEVLKKMLSNIYVDGNLFEADNIDDYELGIELVQESIILNYSSLGKLIRKLMAMLPTDLVEEWTETQ
ncbi:MAG: hypothetical protein HRU26_14255 [Psychroserpens sp.]|nr:hypothetical protein [Psychroserpens sp.]